MTQNQTDTTNSAGRSGVTLARDLGLLALVATAVCNVIGGGINFLTLGVQSKVPDIGPYVPLAYVVGVFPAVFTALAYAVLASAMPRAGGGYIYVSRALHPFLGFMATFSKWFGLSAAVGVIAYMDVALLASAFGFLDAYIDVDAAVHFLNSDLARIAIPLAMIWIFWLVNVLGVRTYGWTVVVLMGLMLAGGLAVIAVGFLTTPQQFAEAYNTNPGTAVTHLITTARQAGQEVGSTYHEIEASVPAQPGGLVAVVKAVAWLFFAYLGFAGISQAGGEARNARRILPRAFIIATAVICGYYLLFSAAVYHAVGWKFIAGFLHSVGASPSVPLLIGIIMPPALGFFVATMAALALANDIPPMLLATSRLFFAWARDGVFPRSLASINRRFRTPHWALTACALVATAFAIACYRWESYFDAVDTIVVALTFTYLLIGISVLTLPRRNPGIWRQVAFIRSRTAQVFIAVLAILFLAPLLATLPFLQGRATLVFWLIVMGAGAVIFLVCWLSAKARGVNLRQVFQTLPDTGEDAEPPAPRSI